MTKKKILIIVICLLAVLLVALIIAVLGGKSSQQVSGTLPTQQAQTSGDAVRDDAPNGEETKTADGVESENSAESMKGSDPTDGTKSTEGTKPTDTTKPTDGAASTEGSNTGETREPTQPEEVQPTLPEELPPEVVIPPVVDPDTGKESVSFPCKVPGYDLVIEKLDSYEGMFVEDGTNTQVASVAMMLVSNQGDYPVEYTQICAEFEGESLVFDISALPAGEKLVVQEKTGKKMPEGDPISVTALVVRRAEMEMSQDRVQVTDNGNNTLTIRNVSGEGIPTIRVFYKYYMENEQIFVGGIAFTLRVTGLGSGEQVTLQPAHYTSQTSRVVMVLTYDSEV